MGGKIKRWCPYGCGKSVTMVDTLYKYIKGKYKGYNLGREKINIYKCSECHKSYHGLKAYREAMEKQKE